MTRHSLFVGLLLASLGWISPANAPAHVTAFTGQTEFKILRVFGHDVRWLGHTFDGETILTYRVVNSSLRFDDAYNCRALTPLTQIYAAGISEALFRRELEAAFAQWSRVARITFVEAASDAEADILIGAQGEPSGRAFAQVFHDTTGASAVRAITRSLICLNPQMPWKIGFDGNLGVYDLRFTLAHEIGHAIGLDHPSHAGQLMWYRYDEKTRELQNGDVSGAVLLFGARRSAEASAAVVPLPLNEKGPGTNAPGRTFEAADAPSR